MIKDYKIPIKTYGNNLKFYLNEGLILDQIFSKLIRMILSLILLVSIYWIFIASDVYVSEASLIIRKTDTLSMPSADLSTVFVGLTPVNRTDQLLMREYLLSFDMLKKLDSQLNLRAHYGDWKRDWISRFWLNDFERFHRYYLSRVLIEYDDYAGVVRIKAEAYNSKMANSIAQLLVHEGERYMNQLDHEMAQTQVDFLINQVEQAQLNYHQASQRLLSYQNKKGLISPQATADSFVSIVAKLEDQRALLQTQLASLPLDLDRDQPNVVMLKQSLVAVDRQITKEKAKLANPLGSTLNITLEEFQRLEIEVGFKQDIYKTSLASLEKGRVDSTRMLEKVSVLETPTMPDYPIEPRRAFNAVITILVGLMFVGILKMFQSILQDHID